MVISVLKIIINFPELSLYHKKDTYFLLFISSKVSGLRSSLGLGRREAWPQR